MGHFLHFLQRWRIIYYLNCANFLRAKKLAVADDACNSKKLRGYKYYLGNFDLSGKNLYNTLLPVNGRCFCRDILSSSLKLPFVSKRAVRHGYQWWGLNDPSFTEPLLSVLKNLCPKQVRKASHLKRNSNQTQCHRSGGQWYGRQVKQIKFSNICLGFV